MSIKQVINPLPMGGIYVIYSAGAIFEKPGERGTMHLMEHLLGHLWDNRRDLFMEKAFSANAYTADDLLVCHLTGPADDLEKYAKDFVGLITGGHERITEPMFDNEKSVVLNEYSDNFADPMRGALVNGFRKAYGMYSAIGEKKDIEAFTYDKFAGYYKEHFSVPNLVVWVGPHEIDLDGIVTEAPKFSAVSDASDFVENRDIPTEPAPIIDKVMVNCFSKKVIANEDANAMLLATMALGQGLNSPLYQEIREKRGLSYYSLAECERIAQKATAFFCSGTDKQRIVKNPDGTETKIDCPKELIGVYHDVFSNLDKYLTKERYDLSISFLKNHSKVEEALRYKNYEDFVIDEFNYAIDPRKAIDVTYEQVLAVAHKYLDDKNMFFYVV
jgi:predicted Zn-dependent peptidase